MHSLCIFSPLVVCLWGFCVYEWKLPDPANVSVGPVRRWSFALILSKRSQICSALRQICRWWRKRRWKWCCHEESFTLRGLREEMCKEFPWNGEREEDSRPEDWPTEEICLQSSLITWIYFWPSANKLAAVVLRWSVVIWKVHAGHVLECFPLISPVMSNWQTSGPQTVHGNSTKSCDEFFCARKLCQKM